MNFFGNKFGFNKIFVSLFQFYVGVKVSEVMRIVSLCGIFFILNFEEYLQVVVDIVQGRFNLVSEIIYFFYGYVGVGF